MKRNKEKETADLSAELLVELRKEQAYREVNDTIEFCKSAGEEIRKARQTQGISVAVLAKKIGKNEKVVQRVERGEYKQYTMKLLLDIARALGMRLTLEFKKNPK